MILILDSQITSEDPRLEALLTHLQQFAGIEARLHQVTGSQQTVTEIYLIGDTHRLDENDIGALEGVER
ncbi:MAG: 3-deoxy-7-phosphoheptulonate synthase, partial [Gammaproteobacteria bacterium]